MYVCMSQVKDSTAVVFAMTQHALKLHVIFVTSISKLYSAVYVYTAMSPAAPYGLNVCNGSNLGMDD